MLSRIKRALNNDYGIIFHENLRIPNVYVPNKKMSKYVWQKLLEQQGERDEFTIIVCDFNTYQQLTDPSGINN